MQPILVALDNSDRAGAVLDEATRVAKATKAQLVLLRVIPHVAEIPYERFGPELTSLTALLIKEARTALSNIADGLPRDMVANTVVEAGTPWRLICDTAESIDASMIVIGAHGYGPLERMVGTTAQRVVNHARRTVLVVRNKPAA